MGIVQKIDRDRRLHKHTLYARGSGFPPRAYYQGGFMTKLADFVRDNKELLSSGATTVDKVVELGKRIADTAKTAKELEKVRELRASKKKEYVMSPEQEERLKSLGSGFATFERT